MRPVYKIETYTGAVLDHTITDEALSIYFKEILTSGIGHFSFSLPAKKGNTKCYDDIAVNDTVKIFLEYNNVGANPNFIGKVGKITSTATKEGWIRSISGMSQGEILLRRFKTNKYYDGVGVSTIVTEWAGDLGLGAGDIAADATAVTLEVKTKSYFDLMQFVSDYWANAGTQLKKDFWVNLSGNLLFKDRPLRTVGVETLTEGHNIITYSVDELVERVKNDITVYGAAEVPVPSDKDAWTDSLTNWSAQVGSVALDAVAPKVGTNSIKGCTDAAGAITTYKRTFNRLTIRDINMVKFWQTCSALATTAEFRILAPDTTNYFYTSMTAPDANWHFEEFTLGPNNEYDSATNPNATWSKVGSPNWWDMQGIQFHFTSATNNNWCSHIDGFWFYPDRWNHNATDGATPKREMEVTDDKLHSDAECQTRAETLLYQLKDTPTQITMTVVGNSNILIGDRLSITLATEGISAANYDVVAVEQMFDQNGWVTRATMVDSANVREEMDTSPLKSMRRLHKQLRELSLSELTVK